MATAAPAEIREPRVVDEIPSSVVDRLNRIFSHLPSGVDSKTGSVWSPPRLEVLPGDPSVYIDRGVIENLHFRSNESSAAYLEEDGRPGSIDRDHVRKILDSLYYQTWIATSRSVDFEVELWRRVPIFAEQDAPDFIEFLSSLPAGKKHVVELDEHGSGFHMHYCLSRGDKKRRTDVLFTFHPKEPEGSPDTLYWEKHGRGKALKKASPDDFGIGRREGIHSSCCQLMRTVGKTEFKPPANKAEILFPVQP